MAFSIKNPEADRLARELAAATGESLTEAVLKALEERLRREEGKRSAPRLRNQIRAIQARIARLPILDERSADEIIGYNEIGVPE